LLGFLGLCSNVHRRTSARRESSLFNRETMRFLPQTKRPIWRAFFRLPGFGEFVRQTLYWHLCRLLDRHESGRLTRVSRWLMRWPPPCGHASGPETQGAADTPWCRGRHRGGDEDRRQGPESFAAGTGQITSVVAADGGQRRDGARKVLGGFEENADIEDGLSGEAGNGRAADMLDGQGQAVKCVCEAGASNCSGQNRL